MKKKIIFLLLISFSVYSQSKIKEFTTKSGLIIKEKDSISIAYPRSGNTFTFITQGNTPAGTVLANTKIQVKNIKKIKNKYFITFKGYGLLPVYIEYESALETGEIR